MTHLCDGDFISSNFHFHVTVDFIIRHGNKIIHQRVVPMEKLVKALISFDASLRLSACTMKLCRKRIVPQSLILWFVRYRHHESFSSLPSLSRILNGLRSARMTRGPSAISRRKLIMHDTLRQKQLHGISRRTLIKTCSRQGWRCQYIINIVHTFSLHRCLLTKRAKLRMGRFFGRRALSVISVLYFVSLLRHKLRSITEY